MIIKDWLKLATARLEKVGIGSARLDCLILLEDILGKDRAWVLANPDFLISKTKIKRLSGKIKKRSTHLPLAFVRGHTEFYGRKFLVNRHTLEPRPESETMITLLKNLLCNDSFVFKDGPCIADVGTGSGALGITAALELHTTNVDLYDIDASALSVARHNQSLHELHLHTRKTNLLNGHLRPYNVILANLPYVPNHYQINQAAAMEPKIAIFGGPDGLDLYRRMFAQLERFSWKPKFILIESLPPQQKELAKIANTHGFKLYKSENFIQVFTS